MRGRPHLYTSYASEMALLPDDDQARSRMVVAAPHLVPIAASRLAAIPVPRATWATGWLRIVDRGPDLRRRRPRAQPPDRGRRAGVARSRLLHGGRRVHGASCSGRSRQHDLGPRSADLDLAAGRRHRRGARRHARRTDRSSGAWSLPGHRHARAGVHRRAICGATSARWPADPPPDGTGRRSSSRCGTAGAAHLDHDLGRAVVRRRGESATPRHTSSCSWW